MQKTTQKSTVVRIPHIEESTLYDREKPYMILQPGPMSIPKTNCFFNEGPMPIQMQDLRFQPHPDEFSVCGFEYIPNANDDIGDLDLDSFQAEGTEAALLNYLQRTRLFIMEYFGAVNAVCIDWRLRAHSSIEDNQLQDNVQLKRNSPIPPAYKAHADLSPSGGIGTVQAHLSAKELHDISQNGSRVRIINCWRPLVDTVEDVPLAMCDRRCVKNEDWLPYDRIDDTGPGEGMWLKQRDWHEWYWFSKMTKQDIVLFQSWDSANQTFQGHTPHAAFVNPNAREGCQPRASIEVRVIVTVNLAR